MSLEVSLENEFDKEMSNDNKSYMEINKLLMNCQSSYAGSSIIESHSNESNYCYKCSSNFNTNVSRLC